MRQQNGKTFRMLAIIWAVLLFKVRSVSPNSDATDRQQTTDPGLDPQYFSGEGPGELPGNTTENPGQTSTTIPSANLDKVPVTCEYGCSSNLSVEGAVSQNAADAKQPEITGETTIGESDALNLTCTVDPFPPSGRSWSTHAMNRTSMNETGSDTGTSTLVIHNMSAENSGQYICTAQYLNNTLTQDVNVTMIYAKQPEITGNTTISDVDALNLTCTVDSFPPSVTMGTRFVQNKAQSNETESETGASSLVIYNVPAEHSGQYICNAKHLNNTAQQDINRTVTYWKKPEITGQKVVMEGNVLNLTCIADSWPLAHVTWSKLGFNLNNETGAATLVIHNVTAEHSGQYVCTAKHLNKTLTQDVNVTVIYEKQPEITGETAITEGDALNLTCRVDSFPPFLITWTKHVMNRAPLNESGSDVGTSILVIHNVTAEHSGQYVCAARHLNITLTQDVNVTVMLLPKILRKSGCEAGPDVLTCVCVSQGFPLPTIKWPLLENHTEYSFNTAVSNHTVTNTVTLTVTDHSRSSAVCISRNGNGETKMELIIKKVEKEDQTIIFLRNATQPGIIISLLIGMLLSAVLFCLVKLCCRKKQKIYGNLAETLEMVESQKEPQITNGEAVEYAQVQIQGTAEEAEAAAGGKSDVDYSDINVLVLERQILGKAEQKQGNKTTEYAEINKQKKKRKTTTEFGEGEEEEGLKDNEGEGGSDDGAVYSNVMDLMDQIS